MQSEFDLTPLMPWYSCIEACQFMILDVPMSGNNVRYSTHMVFILLTDLRSLALTCIIHMCFKDGLHFKFNSGQFIRLPTELPTVSILESSGLPTELPTISINGRSTCIWQPNLHGKIPMGKPMGSPLLCPLSCPLFPYIEVVGSIICMAKFQWAARGQPSPLPTELPTFSYLEIFGSPLSCPLRYQLFPYMEVVCSLNWMAIFPCAAYSVAQVQPNGNELCSSTVFFSYRHVTHTAKVICHVPGPVTRWQLHPKAKIIRKGKLKKLATFSFCYIFIFELLLRFICWKAVINLEQLLYLKLYCGYKYTRPCGMNRILGPNNNNYRWMVILISFARTPLTPKEGKQAKNSK